MSRYILGLKGALADYMISKKQARLTGGAELSKLLSFEEIKAKTFYQIQKNLSQIAKDQKTLNELEEENLIKEVQRLNSSWNETMSRLGDASSQAQQIRWREIVERYYREVDESSFEIFLKDQRKDIAWDCDLLRMEISLRLAKLGVDEGFDALEKMGIKGDIPTIEQKMRGRITNYDLRKSNNKEEESEFIDFYVMLAKMRKRGHSDGYIVDSSILLQEWIGILKNIKNERSNSEA